MIESRCDSSWNSDVLSGNFHVIGGSGRNRYQYKHAVYVKDTQDPNGKWWYFYFDVGSLLWKFWYSDVKPKPGDNIFISEYVSEIVSEYDLLLIGQ